MEQQPGQYQCTPAQDAYRQWIEGVWESLVRGRTPEEHEWFESGLFHQVRQWLERDPTTRRVRPVKWDANKAKPMPVTNHFSVAINRNANALGADIPGMRAWADNYDAKNRRAAEAAERAILQANRESGFEQLNPVLAQMVVLYGIAATKDMIDMSAGAESIETVEAEQVPTGNPEQPVIEQDVPGAQVQTPVSRLKTELLSPFEFYLPRDCGDPNLSPQVIEVRRRRVSVMKALYPALSEQIVADGDKRGSNLAQFYLQSLRRLMTAGSSPQEDDADTCTVFEPWTKWDALPSDVQEAIAEEWGEQPSEHPTYSQKGMTKLQAAQAFGVYAVLIGPVCAEMAECPFEEGFPYTFFTYQKDIANPYPKGLGVEIKPLQKQINRIDSLMLKTAMTGVGRWLIPISQNRTRPTGDLSDSVQWDDEAGKAKPEFISGNPQMAALAAMRQRLVMEFDILSNTSSIDRGQAGATTGPFRALAYLGSKAEESRRTTAFLWDQSHELRSRKLLEMCKLAWDQPRKVKVTGINNRFGAELLDVADLGDGNYSIEVIQDSSRPKTVDEKIQTISTLLQGGLLNPQDPEVRDYIFETFGMSDLDPANHLAYTKAERDLEAIKNGLQPMENPFMNWQIEFYLFSLYVQTEEFEGLDPQIQAAILMWAGYCEMQGRMAAMGVPPAGNGQQAGKAMQQPSPGHLLHGVAGQGVSAGQQQNAAASEGQQFVNSLPQEQSTVQ